MYQLIFNLLVAAALGCIIGLEREIQGKFAGLKTHLLVSLGAAVFASLAPYVSDDSGRIVAQVISGIGFIGAGTIMKIGADVKGITTAACLWVCAGIGLACGIGQVKLAIIATVISFLCIVVLTLIERVAYNIYYSKKDKEDLPL